MSTIEADERGLIVGCPNCGQNNRLTYERLNQRPRCAKCGTELSPPAEPVDIQSDAIFEAIVSHSVLPLLVDFWAPWCGPCKMVAPDIAKIAAENSGRKLVVKANTEELPELARRYSVTSIPLLVLFKGGHEVARQAGARPAPAIRQFIEQAR
ncbi:MAG TPA: thioredoxin [Opitutaceae bacterium]|nr:thioredoxin [Opitutaceae bacterium]